MLCLEHCQNVAALIPASYLHSGLFRKRLTTYILLHDRIFTDTENPVCLALFENRENEKVNIFYDNHCIGTLGSLSNKLPQIKNDKRAKFNDPRGKLGFISFDNTKKTNIKFCWADEIKDYVIKTSSRFITRISGDFGDLENLVLQLNRAIKAFRDDTDDVFLTPFKGLRSDGRYRRRMNFNLARRFINAA